MISGHSLYRALLTGLILVLLALALPVPAPAASALAFPASAAPPPEVTLAFDVVGVTEGQKVLIRTRDFPVRTNFVVLMDKVGKQGRGGLKVDEFNSESGGVIEKTFAIPEALREELILAVRIESKDGYAAYNWFLNHDMAYKPVKGAAKPELAFSAVKKNTSAAVTGKNFPPGLKFSVRVGPYYTFYRDYVYVDDVRSNDDGTIQFDLPLPAAVKDTDYIMVRLDGAGMFAYNNFKNVDGGTSAPAASLYKFEWCKVVSIRPVAALAPGEEFDAVWTVQNTSNIDWEDSEPDYQYRFISGEKMFKYEDHYIFPSTIGNGWVFDIAVDMIAPDTFAGWHSTTWAITKGDKEMCRLPISVFVKDK